MNELDPVITQHRDTLLDVARQSIAHGLTHGTSRPVDVQAFPAALQEKGATFVTLHLHRQLRGCIGTLEARRPLIEDVNENAYAAAFRDPRFPPLSPGEFPAISIDISVLTPPQPLPATDENTLLAQLVPGRDGLILQTPQHRATFLPSVWHSLPERREFLAQLKRKAGLPPDYWSPEMHFFRYRTISVSEHQG